MPRLDLVRECRILASPRVQQVLGMFDVPPATHSREEWTADLPLEEKPWQIGLIVGPSGAGKSTLARELFPGQVVTGFEWDSGASVLDGFPRGQSVKEIVGLLNAVGFSSPPAWLRPFQVLSTGQQFRVTLARALAESPSPLVMDEYTSVVDRTVAQVGSAAVSKAVRRTDKQFVAVTCHYDVAEWLQPDWVFEPHLRRFQWRCLQRRPDIALSVYRVHYSVWEAFKGHHYLTGELNRSARCYAGLVGDQPAVFMSVLGMPNRKGDSMFRGHRTVVLPDFQGVGIGNRFIEEVARLLVAEGSRYVATTAHPAINQYRKRSALWRCTRPPQKQMSRIGRTSGRAEISATLSLGRITASWEFVGP